MIELEFLKGFLSGSIVALILIIIPILVDSYVQRNYNKDVDRTETE